MVGIAVIEPARLPQERSRRREAFPCVRTAAHSLTPPHPSAGPRKPNQVNHQGVPTLVVCERGLAGPCDKRRGCIMAHRQGMFMIHHSSLIR